MDIIERVSVQFARPLRSSELDDLMATLVEQAGFRSVEYTLSMTRKIPSSDELPNLADEHPSLHSLNLSGMFYTQSEDVSKGVARLHFEGIREPWTDLRMLNGIRFQIPPGYDESDIPPRELELIDKTREITKRYTAGV
jgi:hypothetical protein